MYIRTYRGGLRQNLCMSTTARAALELCIEKEKLLYGNTFFSFKIFFISFQSMRDVHCSVIIVNQNKIKMLLVKEETDTGWFNTTTSLNQL